MPHPKMNAAVKSLRDSWITGRKSLLFVRRVKSVKELKRKLDELRDQWLLDDLRRWLAPALIPRLGRNPHTKQAVTITARRVVTFKASRILKAAVNTIPPASSSS